MILEALAQKVKPISKTSKVKQKAMEQFEKLKINEFLDQDNEVFDFDEEYVPDIIW